MECTSGMQDVIKYSTSEGEGGGRRCGGCSIIDVRLWIPLHPSPFLSRMQFISLDLIFLWAAPNVRPLFKRTILFASCWTTGWNWDEELERFEVLKFDFLVCWINTFYTMIIVRFGGRYLNWQEKKNWKGIILMNNGEEFAGLEEWFNIMGGDRRARVSLSCVIQERYEDRGGDKVESGSGNRRLLWNEKEYRRVSANWRLICSREGIHLRPRSARTGFGRSPRVCRGRIPLCPPSLMFSLSLYLSVINGRPTVDTWYPLFLYC